MEEPEKLIKAIQLGDEKAFEKLFYEHYHKLYRFCRQYIFEKEIAEELVQDVFIYIWENRRSLIISRSLSAYLHTAVKNRALNYLKSKYAREKPQPLEEGLITSLSETEESSLDQHQLHQLVQQGIQQLPERCRIIFTLSRQGGLTYDEIAEELSISKESVKSQIKIALQKLRAYLKEYWEIWLIFFLNN